MSRPVANIRGVDKLTLTGSQLRTLQDIYGIGPGTPFLVTTAQLTAGQITHALRTGEPLGRAREATQDELQSVSRWVDGVLDGIAGVTR